MSEDATKLLQKNPQLAESLEHNPNAAAALKFCESPCYFPEGLGTPKQVQDVERIIAEGRGRGMKLKTKKLSEYFNRSTNGAELDHAIAEFEAAFRRVSASPRPPAAETVLDEAELLEQLEIRERKPVGIRLGEAEVGREFDRTFARVYPSNQVPIRDRTGKLRWLDSYDAKAGHIISRKSLASTRGQVAFAGDEKMIEHFQEFGLKYQKGATIADVPSARVQGFTPDAAGNMPTVKGSYILEVPKQDYPIPDRILEEAAKRGITIRPTNFEVTNEYFTALGMFENP